ncbi:VOC family protein [Mycobacterium sp. GA-2829]|uniref:VOC family protein n=1 Tax=Mycobacterium sp. GA-2829 TaxID=1772283 RepID=UPI00073FE8B4|nr:VOC family protein [Mycobacterium sp. GA-2829]KUI30999.1 glyoxalase [Mycobacterium sp. GA-2829]
MAMTVEMITVDCSDPDALAGWWAEAAGGEVNVFAPGEFVVLIRDNGPRLGFQKVPAVTPGKNRVHVDFTAPDADAEAARLVGLGATERSRHSFGDDFSWIVLADPEGNEFCVANA